MTRSRQSFSGNIGSAAPRSWAASANKATTPPAASDAIVANKPLAERGFIFADDTPRRMIRVRQLDRSVGECTAALGLVFLEVTDMAQPGQALAFRIARVGDGERIPGRARSYPDRRRAQKPAAIRAQ
jgi:hypothetical protein